MSPRRKSGLSPEDLQALKHLPAVIRALENLQAQHAKVRALMVPGSFPAATDVQRFEVIGRGNGPERLGMVDREHGLLYNLYSLPATPPGPPSLDTPERQEFERARKEGKVVPDAAPKFDPLANISEAQRERMAEQKALVEQLRAARGKPPPSSVMASVAETNALGVAHFGPKEEEPPVREEVLPESANGSAGVEMQSGGFIDG